MSDGQKLKLEIALDAANEIIKTIRPVCQRIEIAGSLRRKKEQVGDIELVAVPDYQLDLFGDGFYSAAPIADRLQQAGFAMDKDGEKYKKFFYVRYQVWVDLFLTTPEQWGLIYMIRTGSADFSRMMVTPRNQGGHMPSNLRVKDGMVWRGETPLPMYEEEELFATWGMKYIEPRNRII